MKRSKNQVIFSIFSIWVLVSYFWLRKQVQNESTLRDRKEEKRKVINEVMEAQFKKYQAKLKKTTVLS